MNNAENTTDTRPYADLLLRKSKVVREGERALSIRAQEERGRAWADENGYRVRKVWKENLSAWSDVQRPKYDAAMAAVLNGEVPALWCYALDRFSRKGAEAVVPVLGKARVIFDYERLDSMDERDRRWIIDRAENAREYSSRLSYNVRTTKAKQRREGRWLGRVPFGLAVAPSTRRLVPDNTPYLCLAEGRREVTPWQVIQRIYKAIAGGESARGLARAMNAEGLRTVTGKAWAAYSVRQVIIHPVYEGWLTVSPGAKGRVPTHFINAEGERVRCVEPSTLAEMIPASLAARARRVLSGHQSAPKQSAEGLPMHPLAGRIRCSGCGSAMTMTGRSYICQHHHQTGMCPAPASVSRTALEPYVVEAWAARLHAADDHDPLLIAVAERWQVLKNPEESQEITDARAELLSAQAKLDRFMQDDAEGFYTGRSARYRIPHKVAAEKRVDAAEEALKALTGSAGGVDVSVLLDGRAADLWAAGNAVMRRDLLGLAIDRVHVAKAPGKGKRFDGDARVVIEWALPTTEDCEDYAAAA
ncbi:recombinase family protein [Streptomyces albidoflavus]|uniref:recombinase family protein n=1 Tax=Streptomyces albidoflavus TaxID=1886 RepID=UPI003324A232